MTALADTKAKESFDEYARKLRAANIAGDEASDARLRYIYYALQAGWTWNRIGGPSNRKFWDRNRQRAGRVIGHG